MTPQNAAYPTTSRISDFDRRLARILLLFRPPPQRTFAALQTIADRRVDERVVLRRASLSPGSIADAAVQIPERGLGYREGKSGTSLRDSYEH